MMKSKTLLIAMMAMVASAMTFTSCSDDDDDVTNNYTTYQSKVDAQVREQKKNDKQSCWLLSVPLGSRLSRLSTLL